MYPLTLPRPLYRDLAIVLLASFLICLSGSISISLWFTPVPIATRNSLILLLAVFLGPRRGSLAVFAFLAQGALGLPVFHNAASGVAPFFGPLGGYLIGYLIAAAVTGYLAEKKRTLLGTLGALSVGNLIIYTCGAGVLSTFVGPSKALLLGVLPFLLGDVLKTLISLKILQKAG